MCAKYGRAGGPVALPGVLRGHPQNSTTRRWFLQHVVGATHFISQEENEERMILPARSVDHPFIRRRPLSVPDRELTHEQNRCAGRLLQPSSPHSLSLSLSGLECGEPGTRRSKFSWARPSWLQACCMQSDLSLNLNIWEAATASASALPRPCARCRCGRYGPRP